MSRCLNPAACPRACKCPQVLPVARSNLIVRRRSSSPTRGKLLRPLLNVIMSQFLGLNSAWPLAGEPELTRLALSTPGSTSTKAHRSSDSPPKTGGQQGNRSRRPRHPCNFAGHVAIYGSASVIASITPITKGTQVWNLSNV